MSQQNTCTRWVGSTPEDVSELIITEQLDITAEINRGPTSGLTPET